MGRHGRRNSDARREVLIEFASKIATKPKPANVIAKGTREMGDRKYNFTAREVGSILSTEPSFRRIPNSAKHPWPYDYVYTG